MKSIHKLIFALAISTLTSVVSFGQMSFEIAGSSKTGITFQNILTEVDTFNYLNFEYMYNGAGVAVGDINNDGLIDIYFVGNQVGDQLYLNKGNLNFENITSKAFVKENSGDWRTGVTMADVNQDGYLDIYVCRSGLESFGNKRSNLLYINNKDNTFTEQSKEYGIDVAKGSTQAAFFDMDKDGDLDLYVMNRPYKPADGNSYDFSNPVDSDDLFENVNGKFINISKEAGIQNTAFGLGIAISDINGDGYLDIYVSNDYIQPDFCYINQRNKTFKNEIKTRTRHTSHFGMGNDIADFNNDGFVDIMTVDMATADHIKSKRTMGGMNPKDFWGSIDAGNQYEYMFNTLQLNNGNGTFSEMAQLAGVSKTDWSWGPLFVDFDNDGYKDLFVTNGFRREVRVNDYVLKLRQMKYTPADFEIILGMAEESKIPNEMFWNKGNLTFENVSDKWNIGQAVNSNGAAYADFDNDGDVDLVLNNLEDVSYIYENKLESTNKYIRVKLDRSASGAVVKVRLEDGQTLMQEYYTTRGYQSCSEEILHFGLGQNNKPLYIHVKYLDGTEEVKSKIELNSTIQFNKSEASSLISSPMLPRQFFSKAQVAAFYHQEYRINDFLREILLPHRMSELGPFLSAGDVNGDKRTDFYISGSRYYKGALFLQMANGSFTQIGGPWQQEQEREEQGSCFFDADNDGDLDLYIANGGNEYVFFSGQQKEEDYNLNLQDQLYINDGEGKFTNETANRLPKMITSCQRLCTADFDNDGDLDIFVGGRQIPGFYPFAPRSYLLLNNGKGKFTDITEQSPDLLNPGMVTQSLFDDFDQDGDLDLLIVGEWMPPSLFENNNGNFKNVTAKYGLDKKVGWWMSINKGDFNGDGKNDYVLGNIGENNKFHPSEEKPLEIYVRDFDNNGTYDIVLGKYQNGTCYPVRGRQCSSEQMPFITQKFPSYDEFAIANLEKIYGTNELDSALHYTATEFSSCILLSTPTGFKLEHLPMSAQLGPINAITIGDYNNDGDLDILAVGNNYGAEIETVRYDGGRGILLLGDGRGKFTALAPYESGFLINSDAKDMIQVDDYFVIGSNNDSLKIFKWIR